jgi:excisionase family DNA binding protein
MAYQEDDLLTSAELAEALKVNKRTVRRWRNEGTGPPVMWAGGLARYRWGDVLAWMRRRNQEGMRVDEGDETDGE